jgi:hypothetical protein
VSHISISSHKIRFLIRVIGGPGASGVSFIMLAGSLVRNLLGDDWDLIGFDPRGVGLTR